MFCASGNIAFIIKKIQFKIMTKFKQQLRISELAMSNYYEIFHNQVKDYLIDVEIGNGSILLIDSDISRIKNCIVYEVKKSFATKIRYFQAMKLNNEDTNFSFDHLNNKCICIDSYNNFYLFYSYFSANSLRHLLFLNLNNYSLEIEFKNDTSFFLKFNEIIKGIKIQFSFEHNKINRFILPTNSMSNSSLLSNYQTNFGRIDLFAPYGFTISVNHFSIHPFIVRACRESNEQKLRYSEIFKEYDDLLFEKISEIKK